MDDWKNMKDKNVTQKSFWHMTKSNNKITNTSQYDQANQNIVKHYSSIIGGKILYKWNSLQLCPHMKDKATLPARNY